MFLCEGKIILPLNIKVCNGYSGNGILDFFGAKQLCQKMYKAFKQKYLN